MNTQIKETLHIEYSRFENIVISVVAFLGGIALLLMSLLGPLGLDIIVYKTSESAITQTIAQDLVNLFLLAPLCLIGGFLHIRGKYEYSRYFLILVPVYLIYNGLAYGIGMEWSDNRYSGNSHEFFWIYLTFIIVGIMLLLATIPMFSKEDAPDLSNKKIVNSIVILTSLFLALFAMMWLGEIFQVITTGDLENQAYSNAPNLFWVIRYFDLGISIPLGFIAMYLLKTRPKRSYPILLLFFGFFLTMITAVLTMAIVMLVTGDPEFQVALLGIFGVLAVVAYAQFYYLVRHKIPKLF